MLMASQSWEIIIAMLIILAIRPALSAYNRCAGPSLICGYCVLCAPPRNPRTIICQNPARQRNLKTRSPEIHFPPSSTNPLAQIHKSNMLAEFCFAEYAADLKSASSTCCQQTHTQDNWFLYTLDDRSVNLFPGWWRWWWWKRSQENYDSMACISDVWCLVNLSDFFDEKAVKGVRVNMKANDQ